MSMCCLFLLVMVWWLVHLMRSICQGSLSLSHSSDLVFYLSFRFRFRDSVEVSPSDLWMCFASPNHFNVLLGDKIMFLLSLMPCGVRCGKTSAFGQPTHPKKFCVIMCKGGSHSIRWKGAGLVAAIALNCACRCCGFVRVHGFEFSAHVQQ